MKLKVLYIDGIEQGFEVLPYKPEYEVEYYIKNNCIEFKGKKINPPEIKEEEPQSYIVIPFNGLRWIQVEE